MQRRSFLIRTGVAATLFAPGRIRAQTAAPVTRIGFLTPQRPESLDHSIGALREGLAEHGLVEGRNLAIDYRFGRDALERIPAMAKELVDIPVAVILVQGAAVAVVQKLNLPVPVVYVTSGDPILAGFAESLARPLNNMTGMTFMSAEMNVKRLELLRDVIPNLERVSVIANPEHPGERLEQDSLKETAARMGLSLDYHSTRTQPELEDAFSKIASGRSQAICVLADSFALQNRQRITAFAMRERLPVISAWRLFAQSGALFTYGPRLEASYRRLGYFVARIVNGAKPGELPIERPTTFELIVNARTARTLGIEIPASVMARADDVIE